MATASEPRFTTAFAPNSLWSIFRDNELLLGGLEKNQAEYGAELMNNGYADPDTHANSLQYGLSLALAPERCSICEKYFAHAQMHNERCPADLS